MNEISNIDQFYQPNLNNGLHVKGLILSFEFDNLDIHACPCTFNNEVKGRWFKSREVFFQVCLLKMELLSTLNVREVPACNFRHLHY